MKAAYRTIDVPVEGGPLRVGVWGEEGPVVVALHGITANHLAWIAVADELARDGRVAAPDLRGRGRSAGLPGPFGMAAHAHDAVAVLDALGAPQGIFVGHSMGAFVATIAASLHPDRVAGAVLVDGGLPLPVPPGVDVDTLLGAMIGPAMARLAMTFESREAYRAYWQAHPALQDWDERIWAYLDYDLVGSEPELRSSVSVDVVRADAADTIGGDAIAAAVERPAAPTVLLRAERGTMDDSPIYPDGVVEGWPLVASGPPVPGTNHYTIVFRDEGIRAIAAEARAAAESSRA